MDSPEHPFTPKSGFGGVIVRFADKRWYMRDWHSHPVLEINLVVRGSGRVLLENRSYPLLPGHLIWIWPGQWHVPAQWSSDMLMWIVEWHHDYLAVLQKARGRVCPNEPGLHYCRRLDSRALQRMEGILSGTAAAGNADTFNLGLRFALLSLWDEYVRADPVSDERPLNPKLEKVIGRLNGSSDELTLEELAADVRMSPYYLSSLFRQQTGMTIPEYRNRQRLARFFKLYREQPEIRMLQLALDAGFGSYAQFYRVFTAAVGQTPRAWVSATRE